MNSSKTRRLHYSAPVSDSQQSAEGLWQSIPWTARAVANYRAAGGWFAKSKHNFADMAAAKLAGVAD